MIQRVLEDRKRREAEKIRIQEEDFAKAHAKAIENNDTHAYVPRYLPVCLTKMSGTRVPAPTAKAPAPAASAPTKPASSVNTASTSADSASERKPQISVSSSTASKPN
ncbi:BgTH12-07106 [Blumeria graminis f. sp. triticale]|uniref:BgTH12-07106 n=1 Tax=Blumeria graminis f. sp. triticale TaxID=1689686 RepID=A0A9W4D8Q4_BLUGR|nr:BgTH12-07106 [Blumeria graminis f. sp. triticale]